MTKNKTEILTGKNALVSLRPACLADRESIYQWLTCSDVTASIMGPPNFPDHPVPSFAQFCKEYPPFFFDGSQPERGRCFVLLVNGQPVGQINHDRICPEKHRTELDIWLSCNAVCGVGYGTDAIKLLCTWLHKQHSVEEFVISPSARNTRAIRAYEKAGFCRVQGSTAGLSAEYGEGDYSDTVVLVRRIGRKPT